MPPTRVTTQVTASETHATFPRHAIVNRVLALSGNPYLLLQNPNHGPVIREPAADIVFWGWPSYDKYSFRSRLIGFLHDVGNSVWQHNIEQYGIVNLANPLLQVHYDQRPVPSTLTQMALDNEVTQMAQTLACCQNNSAVLFISLPPGHGSFVYNYGGGTCAWHDVAGSKIPYVVLPDLPEMPSIGLGKLAAECGLVAG